MSIRKILKDGLTEMRRKSRLYGLKRSFTKKENEHSEKLIVLGNKAWETRLDMGPIGNLDEVLTQTEEEGKNITAQLQDLNTRETELQEKLKAEKSRFDVEFKDLESKKTPIDLELKQEKDKQKNSQKDSDSIQKRLQHIPKDEEKIKEKMSDSQDDSQLQAEYKKKILSLQEEKELLTQNFQNLSKIIQTSDETIVPLEEQSQLLQEKIKKTKAHHKEEINNLNKALSEVKRKISNLKAKNKEVSQKQDQHFLALGKKLIESKIKNEILSSQLEEVKNIEQEINFIQQDIQSLENRNRYASRWAIWKFVGLVCLFLLVIVGITLGAVWLSKSILRNERSANIAQSETPQKQKNLRNIQPITNIPRKREFTQEEFHQITKKLEKLYLAMESEARKIPRDTFDPQAIIDIVGKDPKQLFQWVRDNTYLVPYRGSLRGPIGVLMDRLGNSLDRSLLLSKLLEIADYETRLVHTVLTDQEARDLQEKAIPVQEIFSLNETNEDTYDPVHLENLARQLQIDKAELKQDIETMAQDEALQNQNAKKTAGEQTAVIIEILGDKLDQTFNDSEPALHTLCDHWWVQWKDNDQWMDFDPNFPDGELSLNMSRAKETFDPENLPEELFHLIKFRIIAERWTDNQLKEEAVLNHKIKPSELMGQPIALNHAAINWPEDLNLLEEPEPLTRLETEILNEKEWLPYLTIGSDLVFQSSFTDTGEINKTPGMESKDEGARGLTRGLFEAFTGADSEKRSLLTAEWIEYEIQNPGAPTHTIRRRVFDMIGPAARSSGNVAELEISDTERLERGLQLLGIIDILPLTCKLSQQYVSWQMTNNLLQSVRPLLEELMESGPSKIQEVAQNILLEMHAQQGPLNSWAMRRHQISQFPHNIYLDSLNIGNLRRYLATDDKGVLWRKRIFDIVKSDVAYRQPVKVAVIAGISQGVADTVAEALELFSSDTQENVSQLMALAADQGIKWQLIQSSTSLDWNEWRLSSDVKERIKENFSSGSYLVIPKRPLVAESTKRIGWWRINPRNGETVGVMDSGFNQALSDNVTVRKINYVRAVKTGRTVYIDDAAMLHAMGQGELAKYMGYQGLNGFVKRCYVGLLRALGGGI
jgi:hypothetical protein